MGKKRFINGELAPPEQPHLFCGGVLRSYQVEGFKWLSVSRNLSLILMFDKACMSL